MATRFIVGCTECPYNSKCRTQAIADAAYKKHSCERWLRRQAEFAQYIERLNAVDRTPKVCLHKVANHQHGTYACYVLDHCRCFPCSRANSTYESERTQQQAYGRWNNYVDAQPAREHVRQLMAGGMGLKRIVAVGNVSQGALWKLLYGKRRADGTRTPSKRVTADLERRVLAIKLDLADGAKVDSTGAVRRIQALVALGWSQSRIAVRLGITPRNFTPLVHGRLRMITAGTDRAVRGLFAELSLKLPPQDQWHDKSAACRARNLAARRGWLPPDVVDAAWFDDYEATRPEGVSA